MQTRGQPPKLPVAPEAKLFAITPPTTHGDGHYENGMLAVFTILGDSLQVHEVWHAVARLVFQK